MRQAVFLSNLECYEHLPLISTKLEAISSAMRALLRLELIATLKVMNWQIRTVL